jgi:hypothetical protein
MKSGTGGVDCSRDLLYGRQGENVTKGVIETKGPIIEGQRTQFRALGHPPWSDPSLGGGGDSVIGRELSMDSF